MSYTLNIYPFYLKDDKKIYCVNEQRQEVTKGGSNVLGPHSCLFLGPWDCGSGDTHTQECDSRTAERQTWIWHRNEAATIPP